MSCFKCGTRPAPHTGDNGKPHCDYCIRFASGRIGSMSTTAGVAVPLFKRRSYPG